MTIERNREEIIIRIPNSFNIDDLQDLTDLIHYKEITRGSKANQSDVDSLVREIKKGRWEKRKSEFFK